MRVQWTRDFILKISEQGLLYFKKRFKDLRALNEFQFENVNSEFHDVESTLSIYFNHKKGVWYFKDWRGQEYFGDVFHTLPFCLA
jgi:hypothetical protein